MTRPELLASTTFDGEVRRLVELRAGDDTLGKARIVGDTLDAICARYYGRTEGVVETVLQANPGLSELGVILPHGTAVELPETESAARTETVNLWD